MAEKPRKFTEKVEKAIIAQVIDSEYVTAKVNQQNEVADYESFVDLLDSVRSEKNYDWRSDINLPEFTSLVYTQSAIDVAQYFQTRDFVEVYLQDDTDKAVATAKASKELINRTLNQRHLHHYQKFVRGKVINNLLGRTYIRCWWEQKVDREEVDGEVDEELGVRSSSTFRDSVRYDRFNYDIVDPRNVFTDNEYVYTLQDKKWIILRFEKTFEELKQDKRIMGYFNLDRLDKKPNSSETETSRETYNKSSSQVKESSSVSKVFDILERHGKYWVKETEDGIRPGFNQEGEIEEGAEFKEVIASFAIKDSEKELIRFQLQPYKDANGNPYRPIIRGLCYIHPNDDGGSGDGRNTRELQIAVNDTFNISQDRVMLATLPVLKVGKHSAEDNPTIRFEPEHVIELEDINQLQEVIIKDDIQGALTQIALLTNKMQTVTSLTPSAQGARGLASASATSEAIASNRTDTRTNYKSMTYENTLLVEFYWMIMQMTWQFAKPETGVKLMGDKVFAFDPSKDYYYKPVTGAIETEESKSNKIKQWTTLLQIVAQIQHPQIVKIFNMITEKIFILMGDEAANVAKKLLNPNTPIQQGGQNQQGIDQGVSASNQNGVPQSIQETVVRDAANTAT